MTRWRTHPLPSTVAVISAQLMASVVAIAATCSGVIWWKTAILGCVTAVGLLVPIRGRLVLDWATVAVRRGRGGPLPEPEITDATAPDGSVAGIVWHGSTACTVIELAPSSGVTRLDRGVVDDDHAIPLAALTNMLVQQDIRLSGIDIVAHGRRVDPDVPAARAYDQLVGPLPAASARTVWLVARLDAADQAAAVSLRGGGADGVVRTLTVASCRIVRGLDRLGVTARVLSATEIRGARDLVRCGAADSVVAGWDHVDVDGQRSTGVALDPRLIDVDALYAPWSVPTAATTVTVRLRRDHRDVRIAASYRFVTISDRPVPRPPGAAPTTGVERQALHSHLPGCAPAGDALTGFVAVDATSLDVLTVPAGGVGQLIGSDADGRGVAVRLVGPDIDRVDVAGERYLVRQVILRAVAIGARVVVCSATPEEWLPLVGSVGDPGRLALADVDTVPDSASAVVCDGVEPPVLDRRVTVIRVGETLEPASGTARVSIHQLGGTGHRIVLWADGSRFDLTLVSTATEATYLGRRRAADAVPAR